MRDLNALFPLNGTFYTGTTIGLLTFSVDALLNYFIAINSYLLSHIYSFCLPECSALCSMGVSDIFVFVADAIYDYALAADLITEIDDEDDDDDGE